MNKTEKQDFFKTYIEIEFNYNDDTLFERMVMVRLQQFSDRNLGTNFDMVTSMESAECNEFLTNGGSWIDWKRIIRQRRIDTLLDGEVEKENE
jgi:hypothetical protein